MKNVIFLSIVLIVLWLGYSGHYLIRRKINPRASTRSLLGYFAWHAIMIMALVFTAGLLSWLYASWLLKR